MLSRIAWSFALRFFHSNCFAFCRFFATALLHFKQYFHLPLNTSLITAIPHSMQYFFIVVGFSLACKPRNHDLLALRPLLDLLVSWRLLSKRIRRLKKRHVLPLPLFHARRSAEVVYPVVLHPNERLYLSVHEVGAGGIAAFVYAHYASPLSRKVLALLTGGRAGLKKEPGRAMDVSGSSSGWCAVPSCQQGKNCE